jgi:hypothetical protein
MINQSQLETVRGNKMAKRKMKGLIPDKTQGISKPEHISHEPLKNLLLLDVGDNTADNDDMRKMKRNAKPLKK